jgi:hypothetical protein
LPIRQFALMKEEFCDDSADIFLLCALVTLAGLSACRPKEIDLPFQTIEQRDASGSGQVHQVKQPALVVVTTPEEAINLDSLVTSEAQTQLKNLNYDAYFAIAVFQGWKSTDGYGIQIERITHLGDDVTVFVQLQEPPPDRKKNDIVTSPYHLVQVQKVGAWARSVTFNVLADGTAIASVSHIIP